MNLSKAFEKAVDLLGAFIFSVITIVAFAQIVNRYVFGHSFVFAEELAVQLMIWIAFLGAAKCVYENANTRMTVVVNMMPPPVKRIMEIFADIICIGFLVVAGWHGFQLVQATWRATTIGTGIPEGLVYLAMPVGSVIMVLFFLVRIVRALRTPAQAGGGTAE